MGARRLHNKVLFVACFCSSAFLSNLYMGSQPSLLSSENTGHGFYYFKLDHGINIRPQNAVANNIKTQRSSAIDRSVFVTEPRHFDIVVPQQGKHDSLLQLTGQLATSWIQFQQDNSSSNHTFTLRLLVSWSPIDEGMFSNIQEEVSYKITLKKFMSLPDNSAAVDFVYYSNSSSSLLDNSNTTEVSFNSKLARIITQNSACHRNECYVANVDVDMSVQAVFFENVSKYVQSGKSVYFPMVWSQYNPSSMQKLKNITDRTNYSSYSRHAGFWQSHKYEVSVMSGPDAFIFCYNTSFIDGGGHDNNFYRLVGSQRNVVRAVDHGLVRTWHPKSCVTGLEIDQENLNNCLGVKDLLDTSPFVRQLEFMQEHEIDLFNAFMTPPATKPTVLIAVSSSRKEFGSRVAAIAKTWGQNAMLTKGVTIRYFVGRNDNNTSISADEDILALMNQANLTDPSSIVVLDEKDDEYPIVLKGVAMIKKCYEILQLLEKESGQRINWMFKVDDDTLVDVAKLQSFLTRYNADAHYYLGQRCYNNKYRRGMRLAGYVGPYCLGGPGYVFSRALFDSLSPSSLNECLTTIDKSSHRNSLWFEDVVLGFCVQAVANITCWNGGSYRGGKVFYQQNYPYGQVPDVVNPLSVSVHAAKDPNDMVRLHQSILHLNVTKRENTLSLHNLFLLCNSTYCINKVADEYETWPTVACPLGEQVYRERYRDVNISIENGKYMSGYEHYMAEGYFTGNQYDCDFSLKERLKECCQQYLDSD